MEEGGRSDVKLPNTRRTVGKEDIHVYIILERYNVQ